MHPLPRQRSFRAQAVGPARQQHSNTISKGVFNMKNINAVWRKLWREEDGQDIAEYAVMLAVILVIVVGTIRLIGSNANNVFSSVASSIQ
jgi:Flp pilus assembly pilin Flp